MLLILDVFMLVVTIVAGIGTALWCWETGLNMRRVPPDKRPRFFQNDAVTSFELYSCWSLIIVPLFAFRFFDTLGWYSLFAYQVYPGGCVVLAVVMFLIHKIYTSVFKGTAQQS